jgi:hypothetical protein
VQGFDDFGQIDRRSAERNAVKRGLFVDDLGLPPRHPPPVFLRDRRILLPPQVLVPLFFVTLERGLFADGERLAAGHLADRFAGQFPVVGLAGAVDPSSILGRTGHPGVLLKWASWRLAARALTYRRKTTFCVQKLRDHPDRT